MGEEWFQNSVLGNSSKQNTYFHTQCVLWPWPAWYLVLNVCLQKAGKENHPYDGRIANAINTISSEYHSRTDSGRKYSNDRKLFVCWFLFPWFWQFPYISMLCCAHTHLHYHLLSTFLFFWICCSSQPHPAATISSRKRGDTLWTPALLMIGGRRSQSYAGMHCVYVYLITMKCCIRMVVFHGNLSTFDSDFPSPSALPWYFLNPGVRENDISVSFSTLWTNNEPLHWTLISAKRSPSALGWEQH